ncbi:MAG: cation:proton antiporter [Bacteroidota bacterium]
MKNYFYIIALIAAAFGLNLIAPSIVNYLIALGGTDSIITQTLWCMVILFGFGWVASEVSEGTIFPSFTLQLMLSIVLHNALSPLSLNVAMIVVICTTMAAIILKSGGDEVVRKDFAKIAYPTIMIAVVGYLATFFVAFALFFYTGLLDLKTAALLSAIIGSTDPAALIPTLKKVTFKTEYTRLTDISVAESALNDAVGAIFTGAVIMMFSASNASSISSMGSLASGLFSGENMLKLGEQFLFGTIVGVICWGIMIWYEKLTNKRAETAYDYAIHLFVPIFAYLLATAIHGNGFLAAFVCGLLANYNFSNSNFHKTLNITETQIESIAKPTIFMMVGPLIGLNELFQYAGVGFAVAMLFIIIARPIAVFVSLLPTKISLKEKGFLCIIRETGVIPVVLAVLTMSQFPNLKMLMPVTAWVVIWTLILLPAITPFWGKICNVLEINK